MSSETPAPAPEKAPETQPVADEARRGPTKIWVPVVLLIGLLVGALLSYDTPSYIGPFPPGFYVILPLWFREEIILHILLSTASIALLIALTVIYFRLYSQTRARFSLGITVVLLALLVEALIQYPLLVGHAAPFEQGQTPYLLYSDAFSIVAYTIFLYLSLE